MGDTIKQTSKPVDGLALSEARGIKKDILNFIAYLNVAPLYELNSYCGDISSTPYVHTIHYRK